MATKIISSFKVTIQYSLLFKSIQRLLICLDREKELSSAYQNTQIIRDLNFDMEKQVGRDRQSS